MSKTKYSVIFLCVIAVFLVARTMVTTSMRYYSNVTAQVIGNVKENRLNL